MTFVSDAPIYDHNLQIYQESPSGYLMLSNGTRYRIVNGRVAGVRDRNGNMLSFNTAAGGVGIITDSLNRRVTITPHTVTNPYDEITYKGSNGAQRTIRVWRNSLGNVLRAGYSLQTYRDLFPALDGSSVTYFNEDMISSVELPNGQRYWFYYNSYGEVARVVLPTGGAIEYDYAAGVVTGDQTGVVSSPGYEYGIYRRVVERRVYDAAGEIESKMTYSRPEQTSISTLGYVVVDHFGQSSTLLSRGKHYFYGIATPAFYQLPTDYPGWSEGKEYQTEWLGADGVTVLRRVVHNWESGCAVSPWSSTISNNHRIADTTTTLVDTNQVSKQVFAYDCYNNQTDVYEYDFGTGTPGPLLRRTHTDYLTTNPYQGNINYATDPNIHIRNLPTFVQVYDGNGTVLSMTHFDYDRYDLFPLQDCPNIVQHDSGFHTGYSTRGNVTKFLRWLLPGAGNPNLIEVPTWSQHDISGNVVKTIDPHGKPTEFDYSDRFDSTADDEALSNAGAPELGGQFSYAFLTEVTNAVGHTAYTQYDYYLGKPINFQDPNGVIGSVTYNDALDRPTQSIQARYVVGVGIPAVRKQTTITYDDANRIVTTTSDRDVFGDSVLTGKSYYDGLGRTWRGAAYEGSTWSITDTQFDAPGRVSQVSNPYRAADPNSASAPSGLWTMTEYDSLGRGTKVTTPDGAHVDMAYNGNQVTVTDQAGKSRRSETDALGRLIKVIEAPGSLNYETTYLYDALDNLRKVTQGAQTRWFAYDSLSRLIRAKNPEQADNSSLSYTDLVTGHNGWSMAYSYDTNGNLDSKTDARNITTTYGYDALNRNTTVNYSDTAINPDILRQYDGATNGKGRFWADYAGGINPTDQVGEHSAIIEYDALGRPLTRHKIFKKNGVWSAAPYSVSQTYDLAGNVTTMTYPSGRTVNYSYDDAGRLSGFGGNLGGSPRTYADTIGYNAAGQMIKERFGTNTLLYHNSHYNNRMQLVSTRVGDSATDDGNLSRGALTFFYGTTAAVNVDLFANDTDNNGNLRRQIHWVPLAGGGTVIPQLDDYTYDALNRVSSFTEHQVDSGSQVTFNVASQSFSYDRYGNKQITSATGGVNNYNPAYDEARNRIVGLGYDAAGNITNDLLTGGTMTYDAENRLLTASSGGSYAYDASGNRIRRTAGGQETWYIYGIGGELLAEYAAGAAVSAPQKEYGYRGGQMLVVWDGSETGDRQLQWLVQDHLGSTRMVIDKTGGLAGVRRHDFAPFGEELFAGAGVRSASNGYSGDLVRQKFGSYERDSETGLDFAQARYFACVQGRFTSTDPVAMAVDRLGDPQRINLYSYTRNNPLSLTDPTGETIQVDKDAQEAYDEYLKFLNKDPKKYSSELATINRLTNSKVNYIVKLGTKGFSETVEGNVMPDDKGNIVVGIRNIGGSSGEKFDLNGRFAHELEHARQFDAGEIAFGRDAKTGKWFAYPSVYDVMDEVKAFNAQLNVAPPVKDNEMLRSLRDGRISDDDRARKLLSGGYSSLKDRGRNLNYSPFESSGKKPGEIVRTTQFYGVVHSVIK